MKFENVLLGLLGTKPFTGYELMKWLDTEGQFVRSNTHHSQIYRELGKMVRHGLIEFEVDPRPGRPDAKVYRITEIGREALLEWARSPYLPTSRFQDPDFVARFMFTVALDLDAAIAQIDAELIYRRNQVVVGRDRPRGLVGIAPIPEFDAAVSMWAGDRMHGYGADSVDRWMDWLEQMRVDLIARRDSTRASTGKRSA
ncbi:PadR family transcriptional regulator [Microbacterium sp. R86528]|uniref:PadR family transcriptional regulator n=1 Tax=Microbacterium sp. R86528 TaxID=3093864 RepID=UPI0037CCAB8C